MSWWRPSTWKRCAPPDTVPADPLLRLGGKVRLSADLRDIILAGRSAGLLLLDLDGFRALRTSRGEDHARRVLRLYAERLERLEQVTAYWLDEDLFAILLPRAGDPVLWLDGLDVDLTRVAGSRVSVGTARVVGSISPREVHQRAEMALRAAKRRGDGSIVDIDWLSLEPEEPITPERAAALLQMLDESYLRVHYQPIVGLETHSTIGFEALARPQLDYGFAGPEDAFAVAARLGLTPELDAVCRHSIFSDGAGFDMPPHSRLHVNVAPEALGHRSLGGGLLQGQLREAGLTADRVVLELTEQVDTTDPVVESELRRLATMGFVLALDDVGQSGAGLRHLKTGLFGMIKVADDVIAQAATSRPALGVIEAACAFARQTGAVVVAEGVESAPLLSFVRRYRSAGEPTVRIDAAQGFQIGKPQPQARTRPRPTGDADGDPAKRTDELAAGAERVQG